MTERPAARSAFTLIEMTIVLAIIAIVTHLAVRETGRMLEERRLAAADRLLEEVRAAVYSQLPGEAPTGFLADMGRLPRLAPLRDDGNGAAAAENSTLSELWRIPSGARPFAIRQAVLENLAVPDENMVASNIYVGTGWRGAYLRLAPRADRLCDPWGNPMETEDAAGLERLFVTNGFVRAIAHYGASAQKGDEHARSISIAPEPLAASLAVTISAYDLSGNPAAREECEFRLYSPAADGLIACLAQTNSNAVVEFPSLAPGTHCLYWKPLPGGATAEGARSLVVPPGGTQIHLNILIKR